MFEEYKEITQLIFGRTDVTDAEMSFVRNYLLKPAAFPIIYGSSKNKDEEIKERFDCIAKWNAGKGDALFSAHKSAIFKHRNDEASPKQV